MNFGQLLEYSRRVPFFKNHSENDAGRLFPDPLFKKKKKKEALSEEKQLASSLVSIYFDTP